MNKYEIIAIDIKEDMLKGVYKPNKRLPFEKGICEKYNVSKMTVKKALDLLVSEGLIVKRRGSGTFIKDITEKEINRIIDKKVTGVRLDVSNFFMRRYYKEYKW